MKRFRYDIVGISEVRWTGKGETPNIDFIFSGEEKTHLRGIGMLLSDKARKAPIGYDPVNSRVITAGFDAVPYKITVIHEYAPTTVASDEDIETFYGILEDALARVHNKNIIIITSDSNAKIGSDNTGCKSVMRRYEYGDRNQRGERLLEFAAVHNLYICNTQFEQKPEREWIWVSPDGIYKNMVNLIFIQKRWKSSVVNCRTFQNADICSDHSLVLCDMDTSTGNRQSIRRPRLNSLKLSVFVENFSLIILIIIFFKINSVFVKIKAKYEKCTFLRKKNEICVFIGRAVKVPLFSLGFQN